VVKKTRSVNWRGGEFWDKDSVFRAKHFDPLPNNPLTADMKRFIRADLGDHTGLGSGVRFQESAPQWPTPQASIDGTSRRKSGKR
jgi:hypothetical protein